MRLKVSGADCPRSPVLNRGRNFAAVLFGWGLNVGREYGIICGVMKKVIITVVGKDTVGIIAKVSAYLAKERINILDISQTVVGGFFNMMMIVDAAACKKTFDTVGKDLAKLGNEIGLRIRCQKSEIFEKMHRV